MAADLWAAHSHTPVFHYRQRDGTPRNHMSRAVILKEFRQHILAPAGVSGWQQFQLRSLRPGGTTDLREAGMDPSIVQKVGKWKDVECMKLYDRASTYMLRGTQPIREALITLQKKPTLRQ